MNSPIADKDSFPFPAYAQRVIDLLEGAGFEAWAVGGFVRDALLGRPVHDVDIATNAHWQQVQTACEAAGLRSFETGVAHGTLSVLVDDNIVEVTTYRNDGSYSDARHPDQVSFVNSIEEDLARRDFTINALAFHPKRGLLDAFGGAQDLEAGLIRAVGVAEERFAEDALRILRAVRFASERDFHIEEATLAGAINQVGKLDYVAAERKAVELNRLLCGQAVRRVLMDYPEIVDAVLPELSPMRNFDQKSPYHIYDIMEHTAYIVEATPAQPLIRWAALLHDVGKPESFTVGENGQGHFFGHAKRSAHKAETILKRFKMPTRFTSDVVQLVRYHDTHIQPDTVAAKKLLRKLGGRAELMRELCDLQYADAQSHAPDFRERGNMARRVEALMEEVLVKDEVFSLRQLAIDGSDIIALGVEAGPKVGELLQDALDEVICERLPNEHDALLAYVASRV